MKKKKKKKKKNSQPQTKFTGSYKKKSVISTPGNQANKFLRCYF